MANDGSGIEWTDATWNPTTGCSRVSTGCDNCYAMRLARRFDGMGTGYDGTTRRSNGETDWTGVVHQHEDRLHQPLRWQKSRLVFVDSMSDLFHPTVTTSFIDKVFAVMAAAERHVFQILTKRPDRMGEYMKAREELFEERWPAALKEVAGKTADFSFPPENIWLGTSVENQKVTDRISHLRGVSAAVRFLSLEPLLGPLPNLNLEGIDWVIVGGESGKGARKMKEEWVIEIKDQCEQAGVPFFFKQWGGVNKKKNGRDLRGEKWEEMPDAVPSQVFA